MRYFALLATIYATTLGTSYPLVDAGKRTTVGVAAPRCDRRTYPLGDPSPCNPENTRDGSRSINSRWSCKGDILEDDDEECWIEYYFGEPQDIEEVRIAFHKGNENTRTLNVYSNSRYHSQIESSGQTNGYQTFHLGTDETDKLKLRLDDWESNSDVWLSITEVMLLVM